MCAFELSLISWEFVKRLNSGRIVYVKIHQTGGYKIWGWVQNLGNNCIAGNPRTLSINIIKKSPVDGCVGH
jgi:hypothetical protein